MTAAAERAIGGRLPVAAGAARRVARLALALIALAVLPFHPGCSAATKSRPIPTLATPAGVPAATPGGRQAGEPYRIRPGDRLDISLPYHPEENATVTVRPDGGIMLALTGDLTAAGLTAQELAAIITERARETLVDPEVIVTVRPGGDLRVYVGGEVERPGFVAYRENLTPIQAIFDRGGVKPTGNTKKIAWITGVTGDGHYEIRKFDLDAALSGKLKKAPLLSPNDVLYVPQTAVGRVNDFVDLYIRGILPTIPRGGFRIPIP